MDFGTFKRTVAAHMQRSPESFVVTDTTGTLDILASAINRARKAAERSHDFRHCRTTVNTIFSQSNGFKVDSGIENNTGKLVKIKTVMNGWMRFGAECSTTDGTPLYPVSVCDHDKYIERLKRAVDAQTYRQVDENHLEMSQYTLVLHGDWVYVTPYASGGFAAMLDVIKWLNPYVNNDDTDFLLEHCEDYMLMRSIWELNFFLKEDNRVTISTSAMDRLWSSVVTWDVGTGSGLDDPNLE